MTRWKSGDFRRFSGSRRSWTGGSGDSRAVQRFLGCGRRGGDRVRAENRIQQSTDCSENSNLSENLLAPKIAKDRKQSPALRITFYARTISPVISYRAKISNFSMSPEILSIFTFSERVFTCFWTSASLRAILAALFNTYRTKLNLFRPQEIFSFKHWTDTGPNVL